MTHPRAAVAILTAVSIVVAFTVTGEGQRRPSGASPDEQRKTMVFTQISSRGVTNPLVLKAMREVPRHLFVPEAQQAHAYEDRALPVGEGQTISQPYIVALMTEIARVEPGHKVLEVGTGSGYQAAILAQMGA